MSKELDKLSKIEKESSFRGLAVPNPRAFAVSTEKTAEFLNVRPNPNIKRKNEELAEKIRINNLGHTKQKKKIKIKSE